MLCRMANWSLFKKERRSGNSCFGCCRASKSQNEWVSQFVPIRSGVLIQQGMQPFSHLQTLTEMWGVTSALHIQINWLVERGPVPWADWSPNLTTLRYFLWGSMVYCIPVTSEEDLIARVHGSIKCLTRQLHFLGHVCETQHRRCGRLYNDVEDSQFEPRL